MPFETTTIKQGKIQTQCVFTCAAKQEHKEKAETGREHSPRVSGGGRFSARCGCAAFALFAAVVFPCHAAPLNDTGITTCSNNTANGLPCPQTDFPGQDAEYGRDAAAAAGTLTKIGGGRAGFDFTKLDVDGNALPASATEWSCVRDNVTGLTWEVKTADGGLRDQNNTYTWYNPDPNTNGGDAGTQNGGTCTGGIACDTYHYAQAVNTAGLCGAGDWRLPSQEELISIVDFGIPHSAPPTIDTAYFPYTPSWLWWSASPNASGPGGAWVVNFFNGSDVVVETSLGNTLIRLVRGGQ